MPTKASPSGGTASPSAAPQMCSGVWGRQLHGGRLFWFYRKEMVSPSSHPAAQPKEVPRWDVQGDWTWGGPPRSPANSTARVMEAWCSCGQSPLETRSPFPHPLGRATSQEWGHHQLRGVAWTEKILALLSLEGVGLGAAAIDLRTNGAIAEVPPPGKHPLVGDTEAESAIATKCPPESPQFPGASSPIPTGALTAAALGTQWL